MKLLIMLAMVTSCAAFSLSPARFTRRSLPAIPLHVEFCER
jgi:hypothetical protein